jgi:hypothetical protein
MIQASGIKTRGERANRCDDMSSLSMVQSEHIIYTSLYIEVDVVVVMAVCAAIKRRHPADSKSLI